MPMASMRASTTAMLRRFPTQTHRSTSSRVYMVRCSLRVLNGSRPNCCACAAREGPLRWATGLSRLHMTRVNYRFDYPFAPAEVVEFFRTNYGPTTRAFASLGDADRAALRADLVQLWTLHNTATTPGRTIVDSEYLE